MNTETRQSKSISIVLRPLTAAMLVCGLVGSTYGFSIDTDNPDITASWGNTVRYNIGVRTHERDPVIANTMTNDESEYLHDKGDVVTNRLDLLTEFDFDYKKQMGFRVSAAAWDDLAFRNNVHTAPGLNNVGSYTNNQFSSYMKRYYRGISGEWLDAFVYGNFDLGSMPGNLKVGRNAVLWGEAISLSNHSVSYNQTSSDGRKAIANPGITAKEAARPIGQVYATLQLNPELVLAGQYFYEWEQNTAPEGGSYLGVADFIMLGPKRFCLSPAGPCLANAGMKKPKQSGDWGLSLRWKPDWLGDGTLGFYAREFDERNAWTTVSPPTKRYIFSFAEGTRLYGVSLSKNIGGVSVGAELVNRHNTALQAASTDANLQGPRGNTTHALINGQIQFGTAPVWSSAVLTAELAYAKLRSFTSNAARFKKCVGNQNASAGCSTNSNWVTSLSFSPTWTAVSPGWDLTAAARLVYGLRGNTPVLSNSSGRERTGSYSLSLALDYNARHNFALAYNGYLATYKPNAAHTAIGISNGDQLQDRNWVSFTYQASF